MEKIDFAIHRGESFRRVLILKRGGEVMDLSGSSAECELRLFPGSRTLTAALDCAVTPDEGKITLSLSAESTAALQTGSYAYDLKWTDAEGAVRLLIGGAFTVLPAVTEGA